MGEKKQQMLMGKRGDLEYVAGNERRLMERAQQEGEKHERHIAHLRGLSNAKTKERVRRKQLAKQKQAMPTVSIGIDRAAGFLGRLLSNRTKVSVRAADPTDDSNNTESADEDPEVRPPTTAMPATAVASATARRDTMSTTVLAQKGMHRSATNPKQLKVSVPSGPLPNADTRPQGAAAGLIDEMNSLFPELVEKQ